MEEHQINQPPEQMDYELGSSPEQEEYEPSPFPEQVESRSAQNVNPMYLAFTLAIVFLLGLAIGFIGRPVLIRDLPIEVVVTMAPNENQAAAQANAQTTTTERNGSMVDAAHSQSGMSDTPAESNAPPGHPTPTIMDFVLADARHFQGSEAAPVIIVEFSDFN